MGSLLCNNPGARAKEIEAKVELINLLVPLQVDSIHVARSRPYNF